MTAESIGGLIEVYIVVSPIEGPKRCYTGRAATDYSDLLPRNPIS